ncbi:MAG: VCBS repeat-containing protein, partial [Calditrichaeota bacterium]
MKFSAMVAVVALLLFSGVVSAQNRATGNFDLVWSVGGEQQKPLLKMVWDNTAPTMSALPDSIIHIKNVKAGTDLDQDGHKEFIVPVFHVENGVNRRSIHVFENRGNDRYVDVWSYQFPDEAGQFVTVDESDLDGDGVKEILVV